MNITKNLYPITLAALIGSCATSFPDPRMPSKAPDVHKPDCLPGGAKMEHRREIQNLHKSALIAVDAPQAGTPHSAHRTVLIDHLRSHGVIIPQHTPQHSLITNPRFTFRTAQGEETSFHKELKQAGVTELIIYGGATNEQLQEVTDAAVKAGYDVACVIQLTPSLDAHTLRTLPRVQTYETLDVFFKERNYRPLPEQARQFFQEKKEQIVEGVSYAAERVKGAAIQAKDATLDAASHVKNRIEAGTAKAGQRVAQVGAKAAEKVSDVGEALQQGAARTEKKLDKKASELKEKAAEKNRDADREHKLKDAFYEAARKAKEKALAAKETIADKASDIKEEVEEGASSFTTAAADLGRRAYNATRDGLSSAQESISSVFKKKRKPAVIVIDVHSPRSRGVDDERYIQTVEARTRQLEEQGFLVIIAHDTQHPHDHIKLNILHPDDRTVFEEIEIDPQFTPRSLSSRILHEKMKGYDITELVVYGFSIDEGVKRMVLDARSHGYPVSFILELSRGELNTTMWSAIQEMTAAGAQKFETFQGFIDQFQREV